MTKTISIDELKELFTKPYGKDAPSKKNGQISIMKM